MARRNQQLGRPGRARFFKGSAGPVSEAHLPPRAPGWRCRGVHLTVAVVSRRPVSLREVAHCTPCGGKSSGCGSLPRIDRNVTAPPRSQSAGGSRVAGPSAGSRQLRQSGVATSVADPAVDKERAGTTVPGLPAWDQTTAGQVQPTRKSSTLEGCKTPVAERRRDFVRRSGWRWPRARFAPVSWLGWRGVAADGPQLSSIRWPAEQL